MERNLAPILWSPPTPERTAMHAFAEAVAGDAPTLLPETSTPEAGYSYSYQYSYPHLHRWSVTDPEAFWHRWLVHSEIMYSGSASPTHDGGPFHRRVWFPNITLSVA
ncbi:MAG: hypothetical protein ACOCU4_08040, partial [Alkalispirochaeta sp.]